jgi:hypothetical protein
MRIILRASTTPILASIAGWLAANSSERPNQRRDRHIMPTNGGPNGSFLKLERKTFGAVAIANASGH